VLTGGERRTTTKDTPRESKRTVKETAMSKPIICPGCHQRITFSRDQGFTECGGEGNGVCAETVLAHDLNDGKGLRSALKDYTEFTTAIEYEGPIPTVDLLVEILDAHDAVAAESRSYRRR